MTQRTDWQSRVIAERDDLHLKIEKLTEFLLTPASNSISTEDRDLLLDQRNHMFLYHAVLNKRIARF